MKNFQAKADDDDGWQEFAQVDNTDNGPHTAAMTSNKKPKFPL